MFLQEIFFFIQTEEFLRKQFQESVLSCLNKDVIEAISFYDFDQKRAEQDIKRVCQKTLKTVFKIKLPGKMLYRSRKVQPLLINYLTHVLIQNKLPIVRTQFQFFKFFFVTISIVILIMYFMFKNALELILLTTVSTFLNDNYSIAYPQWPQALFTH